MDQKIVLKDGTEFLNGSASRSNNELLIIISGRDIVDATVTFSDPDKTEEIVCYYSVYKKTYFGFTQMYSVQYFSDEDQVHIWLKGAMDTISEMSEYTVPEEYLPESMLRSGQEET